MTAHALASERERCLEAGMDGHLAKPFEPEDLFAALERWGRLPGLRAADPPRLEAQRIRALERDLTGLLAALRTSLAEGDAARAGRVAHALKGLAGQIPAPGFLQEHQALEEAVRAGRPWLDPARSLDRALAALVQALPPAPAPGPARQEPPPGDLGQVLRDLDRMLRRRSLSARKVVEDLAVWLDGDPRLRRLEGCMQRLDFKEAAAALAELAGALGQPL